MRNLSVWQIVAWSCCAGPIVLLLVLGLANAIFNGLTQIIHGHAPASKDDPEPDDVSPSPTPK